ncbi:MAG: hypothetical protein AAFP19_04695 [Bacteroidota bacterium]
MMTRLLSLLMIVLMVAACNKDDDDTANALINFDGNNFSGPLLDIGDHEAAVRFPASMMSQYTDQKLDQISFYILNPPVSCIIKIYDNGSNTQPGSLLYQADVTNAVRSQRWHEHDITRDINIDGNDLWISIALGHDIEMQSIGCDSGPAENGGDWLLDAADGLWIPYNIRTPESVNWNIRARLRTE